MNDEKTNPKGFPVSPINENSWAEEEIRADGINSPAVNQSTPQEERKRNSLFFLLFDRYSTGFFSITLNALARSGSSGMTARTADKKSLLIILAW